MRKISYVKDGSHTEICFAESIDNLFFTVHEIGHSIRPANYKPILVDRNLYALHYVVSGKGIYQNTVIEAPVAFMMTPENLHFYESLKNADEIPWEHYWILFSGSATKTFLKNAGIPIEPHIFECPYIQDAIQILHDLQDPLQYVNHEDNYLMLSGLFKLFSFYSASVKMITIKQPSYSKQAVQAVCDFIHKNYSLDLCEKDLADQVSLSTKYMHRIFKGEIGMPPIRYLNSYRIQCARNLISGTALPLVKIANEVGFSDVNYFFRVFQKYSDGMSPTQYKKIYCNSCNNDHIHKEDSK